jgi:hypothetical protein
MSFNGRSLDDLPLAAYTTGVVPDEDESLEPDLDPDLVAPPALTQRDLAAALVEPAVPAAQTSEKKPRGPRPSLKLPSPRLPSLRRSRTAALQAAAPFQPVAAGAAPAAATSASFQPVSASAPPAPQFHSAAAFQAAPAFEAVQRPGGLGPQPTQPKERVNGAPRAVAPRLPRLALRDPRVLAGGVIVVGLALLGFSLLGGGRPASGSTGPNSSQNPGAFLPTAAPGNASVEVTSSPAAMHALTGSTGFGAPVNSQLNATWTGATGESLGITGAASQGTRTTDPTFFLSWTMLIDGQSETFTSRASECTIGMAVGVKAVHGTFVCKSLRSGDGRYRIDFRGEYTT